LRLEFLTAALADVEELASIGRHFFGRLKAASWASQGGFKLHAAVLGFCFDAFS
jgi:hypothetical protein